MDLRSEKVLGRLERLAPKTCLGRELVSKERKPPNHCKEHTVARNDNRGQEATRDEATRKISSRENNKNCHSIEKLRNSNFVRKLSRNFTCWALSQNSFFEFYKSTNFVREMNCKYHFTYIILGLHFIIDK